MMNIGDAGRLNSEIFERNSVYPLSDLRPASGGLARLYFPLLASVFGLFVFSGITWLLPVYFCLGYVVLSLTLVGVTRHWRDYLNPLVLVLVVGFVRFSLPGFLASANLDPKVELFTIMKLEKEDWIFGHALALLGLLGIVIGWVLPSNPFATLFRRTKVMNMPFSGAVPQASMVGMLVGFGALLMFVGSNASFGDAIYTGEMRGAEIKVGTGKYFHLSLIFIASSIVFSAYLVKRRFAWWTSLIPVVIAASCFVVLGGRIRAFLPIAAGLLMLWYRNGPVKVPVVKGAVLAVGLALFAHIVQVYRGAGIEEAIQMFSISSLTEYFQYAIWADWGQLHALAGATAMGPGVLRGWTFLLIFWPLSELLDLPTPNGGILIAEALFGFGEHRWSFHAALIGDAYLNFGPSGVLITTSLFGAIVKGVYVRMRRAGMNNAIYGIILVYSIRIFFEGIEEFSETLIVLTFAWMVIYLGHILEAIHIKRAVSLSK